MTPSLDIAAIRKRLEAATPGEWKHYHGKLREQFPTIINEVQFDDGRNAGSIIHWSGFDGCSVGNEKRKANADFIAAAPTDIANLLSEVEKLRAALDELIEEYWQTTKSGRSGREQGVIDRARTALTQEGGK
jgi:hypothetical protein